MRSGVWIHRSCVTVLPGEDLIFFLGPLDLLPNGSRQFGQQVAPLFLSFFSLLFKEGDFALASAGQFLFNCRQALFCLADLSDDTDQLGPDPLALHCARTVLVLVENTLQCLCIAFLVRAVSIGHKSRAAFQVAVVPTKVGMNSPGNFAEQALEFGRRNEVLRLRCRTVSIFVSLACLFAGILCLCPRRGRRMESGLQLREARLQVVQFSVKRAHLSEVAPLKNSKLAAKIEKLQLT